MKYSISNEGPWPVPSEGGQDYWPSFVVRVRRDGEPLFVTRPLIERPDAWQALHEAGMDHNDENADSILGEALLRYTIAKVEDDLALGILPTEEYVSEIQNIELGESDIRNLADLITENRQCHYQQRESRELLCNAASPDDPTSIAVPGSLRHIAPTSSFLCNECNLPKNELLCSHLIRPQVREYAIEKDEFGNVPFGARRRVLVSATCDLGRMEVEQPRDCCIGGHDCAERIVGQVHTVAPPFLSPTALTDALSYLDAIWRAAFGRNHGLVNASIDSAGQLTLACESGDDFRLRLIALAETLGRFTVQDDLLSEAAREDLAGRQPPAKSLDRIEILLRERLDEDAVGRALEGISALRHINRLRSTHAAHPGSTEARSAAVRLGLTYPPPRWSEAWENVRWRSVQALTEVREAVATLLE